ncbi:MAG TPA: helix-turn-helix transcriptional regulator [Rhizomicrobium sp.]
MSLDAKLIGARIKSLRDAKGMSQRELGAIVGTDRRYFSAWEKGVHVPSLRFRAKIADALGISLKLLLANAGARVAEARETVLLKSIAMIEKPDPSPSEMNAATNGIVRTNPATQQQSGAREEEIRQQMRGAREEFLRKLARLEQGEG